jgi:protein kinase C substrate 80K-H
MNFAVICFFCSLSLVWGIGRPRGVSIEKASFYGGPEFKCLSDGEPIPMNHVNDDYCDCADGSDEPGTSACNNGLFFCENKSYKGVYIISSRVNDGICDCCDGSDEYDGTISCEDTCEQLNAESRAQLEAFKQKQEKGYAVKLEYMQQGRRTKDEKISQLSDLTKEKDSLAEVKNTLQVAKEEAEVPEKVAKEKHEKVWEAVKAERQKAKDAEKAAVAFAELDVNQDKIVDYPEIMKCADFDIDSDGTVSEEEAKEYLEDSEQTDLDKFTNKIWPNIKEIYKSKASKEEEPERVLDEGEKAGDPLLNTVSDEDKMPDYDEETQKLIEVADEARRKFEDAERKVKDVENEISDINKYLELDLGPEEEFSALKGQCFEFSDREYTYRLCPFEKTSQKSKGGGIETNLGVWGHWYGPEGDKYDAMKYENGQGCWNGPSRSCHVNLHCGAENALTGASEPSRCEYQFEFTTPARCAQPDKGPSEDTHDEL